MDNLDREIEASLKHAQMVNEVFYMLFGKPYPKTQYTKYVEKDPLMANDIIYGGGFDDKRG